MSWPTSTGLGRAGAEVVAETAAFVPLSAVRLDTVGQSAPNVAGWADAAPKEMAAYAEAVHRIAARLEHGLGLSIEPRHRGAGRSEPRGLAHRGLAGASRTSSARDR